MTRFMIFFAALFMFVPAQTMADEALEYKGWIPSVTTFNDLKAYGDPRNKASSALGHGDPFGCERKAPGLGDCGDVTTNTTWFFVDYVLARVSAPIAASDFDDVLQLVTKKYGSSYVVGEENLTDNQGQKVHGYHTYTWERGDRKLILFENVGTMKDGSINVFDVKLDAEYAKRTTHVSI